MRSQQAAGLALALTLVLSPSAFGTKAGLRESAGPKFPDRSFVLTLPAPRDLGPGDVEVTENGRAVQGLTVTAAGSAGRTATGSVLVIDASNSMRGAPIGQAMDAARAFAAERRPNQPLGVVFFSREARVALPLTTNGKRIDAVLAHPPVLSKGTQFRDAAMVGLDLLGKAKIGAGSVVLLSDGADAGSSATPTAVSEAAAQQKAQIITVGLRSPSYAGSALSELSAATGGEHTTALGAELRRVFSTLGAQLAGQYIVRYRSLAALEAEVRVEADVAGVPQPITAAYTAPKFAAPDAPAAVTARGASSGTTVALVALILASLIGLAFWLALRKPARTVQNRVDDYGIAPSARVRAARPIVPERSLEKSLGRANWWKRFAEDLELAGIAVPPMQIALATLLLTFTLMWLFGFSSDRPGAALLFAFTPLAIYATIRSRVARRRREFAEQLADTLQVVASAMRAGQSFSGALAVAVQDADEPTRSELGRVVRDEQLGVPIEKATAEGARRMDNRELEQVGLIAALQRQAGGNTAEVIDHLTDNIRERDGLRRLVRTLTAQGRTAGIALSLLPIGLSAFFAAATPDYFSAMLDHTSGRLLLLSAVGLIVAGWFAIRKVVDIKL